MLMNRMFFINSVLLGIGLSMDAFSVSIANALTDPHMHRRKQLGIAGVFAAFQALMPMIGWICVHTIVRYFRAFESMIPWIALLLLVWIGGKMLFDGIRGGENETVCCLTLSALLVQGIATSIDALSVGFTIANYTLPAALLCAIIIALVTFVISFAGVRIGKRFGTRLAGRAQILGGVILIGIGLEIFLKGIL